MTEMILGGYHLLTTIQLCNVLDALERQTIQHRAFRTFFAAVASVATREAAARATPKKKSAQFQVAELRQLVGCDTDRSIKRALRQLSAAKLLTFSESAIAINREPLENAQALIEEATGQGRSARRLIPVPRRILRYLAQCKKPSVAKAILAYLIRGLTRRRSGEIVATGSVKSSWIAKIACMSLRSAKAARKTLIEMGWLSEDKNSTQGKLNRTGAYFKINLAWSPKQKLSASPATASGSEINPGAQDGKKCLEFAPPPTEKCTEFAPPYKDRGTLSDLKHQKPSSGVLKKRIGKPRLSNIQPQDLKQLSRVMELYHQAVAQGWFKASESNLLFFIAAAVRVKQTSCADSVRVFVGIVRQNLREHITQSQEDYARKKLARYREKHPWNPASEVKEKPKHCRGKVRTLLSTILEQISGKQGGERARNLSSGAAQEQAG